MIGIKMKMPKSCKYCPLCKPQEDFVSNYFSCGFNGNTVDCYLENKKPEWCPLIQL